jgi:Putative zinc-finger
MQHQDALDTLASERYLLGEMDAREREAFEAHFFACAPCAEDVRAGATLRDGVRAGFAKAPASTRRWRPEVVVPWAAAASLAMLAGYQSFGSLRGAAVGAGPLPLAPVTLRSATRGQTPVVSPGPGGLVTLAIDLGGARFDKGIRYELRRADQTKLAAGDAAAPIAGAPLLLVVPASLLNGPGQYVLLVQEAGNAGLTPEEYRFSVGAR